MLQSLLMLFREGGPSCYLIVALGGLGLLVVGVTALAGLFRVRVPGIVWAAAPLLMAATGAVGTALGLRQVQIALGMVESAVLAHLATVGLGEAAIPAMLGAGMGGALLFLGALAALIAVSRPPKDEADARARAELALSAGLSGTVSLLLLAAGGWAFGARRAWLVLEEQSPGLFAAELVRSALNLQRLSWMIGGGAALLAALCTVVAAGALGGKLRSLRTGLNVSFIGISSVVTLAVLGVLLPLGEEVYNSSDGGILATSEWSRQMLPVNKGQGVTGENPSGRPGLWQVLRWSDGVAVGGAENHRPIAALGSARAAALAKAVAAQTEIELLLNESDAGEAAENPWVEAALVGGLTLEVGTGPVQLSAADLLLTGDLRGLRLITDPGGERVYTSLADASEGLRDRIVRRSGDLEGGEKSPTLILVPGADWSVQDLVSACVAGKVTATSVGGKLRCVLRDALPEVATVDEAGGGDGLLPGRGEIVILGSISADDALAAVIDKQARVHFCSDEAAKRRPGIEGTVTIKVVVGADGAVTKTAVRASTVNDPRLESCLGVVAEGMEFPALKGGGIAILSLPFHLGGG